MKAKRLTAFDILGVILCVAMLAIVITSFWLCHLIFTAQVRTETQPPTTEQLSAHP